MKVYRLITRGTYEATMFDRACQKLSLEQAVLGGDAGAYVGPNRQRDASELERMLRLGAYAVLEGANGKEGNGEGGAEDVDATATAFMQSSIEDLLATRTRTVEVGDSGVGFGSAAGVAPAGPDLEAEDFWQHFLPGFHTAEALLRRLHDPDGPVQRLKAAKGRVGARPGPAPTPAEKRQLKDGRDEFVEDVAGLVEYLCGSDEDGLHDVLLLAKNEVDAARKMVTIMTTMEPVFTPAQLELADGWMQRLEGTRTRTCRAEKTLGLDVGVASDSDSDGGGSSSLSESDIFGAAVPAPDVALSPSEGDADVDGVGDVDADGTGEGGPRPRGRPPKGRPPTTDVVQFKGKVGPLGAGNVSLTDICALCEDGGLLLVCDGPCNRAFHLPCVGLTSTPDTEQWLCPDCVNRKHTCLVCGEVGTDMDSKDMEEWNTVPTSSLVRKCSMNKCGRFYHRRYGPSACLCACVCVCRVPPFTRCGALCVVLLAAAFKTSR